jgi:uncharacterized protein (TIGR02285 family)
MSSKRRGLVLFCAVPAAGVMLAQVAAAQQPIALLYNERPPYIIERPDGSAEGLTATPAANMFRKAGIAVVWKKMPTNRQIAVVKDGGGDDCAIGWFRNPEREHFAKFTKPIYRDRPTVLLANRDFIVPLQPSLRALLARRDVRVLVKEGFSYGAYIDGLLAALKPQLVSTAVENVQMIRMIGADRADFMFVAEEEASYLVERAGFHPGDFRLIHPVDVQQGEKRYVMCSRHIDDRIIERLNAVNPFE